jgi:hypothetical protein
MDFGLADSLTLTCKLLEYRTVIAQNVRARRSTRSSTRLDSTVDRSNEIGTLPNDIRIYSSPFGEVSKY